MRKQRLQFKERGRGERCERANCGPQGLRDSGAAHGTNFTEQRREVAHDQAAGETRKENDCCSRHVQDSRHRVHLQQRPIIAHKPTSVGFNAGRYTEGSTVVRGIEDEECGRRSCREPEDLVDDTSVCPRSVCASPLGTSPKPSPDSATFRRSSDMSNKHASLKNLRPRPSPMSQQVSLKTAQASPQNQNATTLAHENDANMSKHPSLRFPNEDASHVPFVRPAPRRQGSKLSMLSLVTAAYDEQQQEVAQETLNPAEASSVEKAANAEPSLTNSAAGSLLTRHQRL